MPDETEAQRYSRYQAKGVKRKDLSGPVSLSGHTAWDLTVWATTEDLIDGEGVRRVTMARLPAGNELEVYVATTHPVFVDCGRDVRDFAIMEAATTLATQGQMAGAAAAPTLVTAELITTMPDQRFTEPLMKERVETVLNRVREMTLEVVAEDSEGYWGALAAIDKEAAEEAAASAGVTDSGMFALTAESSWTTCQRGLSPALCASIRARFSTVACFGLLGAIGSQTRRADAP